MSIQKMLSKDKNYCNSAAVAREKYGKLFFQIVLERSEWKIIKTPMMIYPCNPTNTMGGRLGR